MLHVRVLTAAGQLLIIIFFSSCTMTGSWDYIHDKTHGDVLIDFLARYSFDSASQPAGDDTGSGNNGTANNVEWVSDETRGGVLEFDGSDSYLDIPEICNEASSLSITAWIKVDDLDSNFSTIYAVTDFNPQGIHIHVLSNGRLQVGIGGHSPLNVNSLYSFDPGGLGVWTHIAVVYDFTGMRTSIYVNGRRDVTGTYSNAAPLVLGEARIGHWNENPPGSPRWFDGRIDDIRFYDRALSDYDVYRIFAATR